MPSATDVTPRSVAQRGLVLLLGPPGSGKGTVAASLLTAKVIDRHVSMGELLREAVDHAERDPDEQVALSDLLRAAHAHDDPVGAVRQALAEGQLIPEAWSSALLERALHDEHLREARWALDGYPRQVSAAEHLLRTLDSLQMPVLKVVHLELPEEEVRRRLRDRGRKDDTPESVEERLEVYREEVLPAVTYLREALPEGTVVDVDALTPDLDAEAGAAEVQRRVLQAVVG